VEKMSRISGLLTAVAAVATLTLVAASPAAAGRGASAVQKSGLQKSELGYSAIPSKVPGNPPSLGFEASATDEFGDLVTLGGTARQLVSVSVLLSSWGCENGSWNTGDCQTTPGATFDVPMTFKIYCSFRGHR